MVVLTAVLLPWLVGAQSATAPAVFGGGKFAEGDQAYEAYKLHQTRKLDDLLLHQTAQLTRGDAKWLTKIPNEYRSWGLSKSVGGGQSVLCLGARLGGEVRAFMSMGALAIGVDLNPGSNNTHVLVGDFHKLQFADHVFDVVYTNVLGHAWDLRVLGLEICRVLRPSGTFHMDARPDVSRNAKLLARKKEAISDGSRYETIGYSSAHQLAKGLGLDVEQEPTPDVVVCRCRNSTRQNS